MLRFYYSPGACSLAAHIVLEEIGIPYEEEIISARPDGEGVKTTSPAWKAINPKGRVPALAGVPGRIGGAENLLTEVNAIMVYLARTHPAAGLLPTDPAAEARCLEWMNWLTGSVHATAWAQMIRPYRFSADDKCFPSIKAKGEEDLRAHFAYIDGLLADGRDWAVPGSYSVVDPYLLVFYGWGKRIGWDMAGLCPAWTAHAAKVLARPAVQRIIARENLSYF